MASLNLTPGDIGHKTPRSFRIVIFTSKKTKKFCLILALYDYAKYV